MLAGGLSDKMSERDFRDRAGVFVGAGAPRLQSHMEGHRRYDQLSNASLECTGQDAREKGVEGDAEPICSAKPKGVGGKERGRMQAGVEEGTVAVGVEYLRATRIGSRAIPSVAPFMI